MGHAYTSTACLHGICGSCRATCKFCDEPCRHGCHPAASTAPVAGVDQAREIARELLDVARPGALMSMPPDLYQRIRKDPALFWLRGETVPDGTWRSPSD